MNTPETTGGVAIELAASPNLDLLRDFASSAIDQGMRPHTLVAGPKRAYHPMERPEQGDVIDAVWVLRPPLEKSRYHAPQPGIGCTKDGQIFKFEPNDTGNTVMLPANCPAEGINPASLDESWIAALVDTAQANVDAAMEAKMPLGDYTTWARNRQASGCLALNAASVRLPMEAA